MFTKSTTLVTLFAVAARVAIAAPPACMIAAVNTQPNPGDIQAVCNSSDEVEQHMSENCGEYEEEAMDAFKQVCQDAGVSVSTSTSTSTSTASFVESSTIAPTTTSTSGSSANSPGRIPAYANPLKASASDVVESEPVETSLEAITSTTSSIIVAYTSSVVLSASYDAGNGTLVPSGTAAPTSGAGIGSDSGSDAGATATPSASTEAGEFTGAASRFGTQAAGVVVLGAFAAVLAI